MSPDKPTAPAPRDDATVAMPTGPRPGSTLHSYVGGWQPPTVAQMQAMLPQYEFVEMLGAGGMGAVYKARQVSLDRLVAIKILPPGLEDGSGANFTERFKQEAKTMAKMSHPCIVNVHDFGQTPEGQLYFVMEFIEGTDVQKMIRANKRLKPDDALAIAAHVCDALDYAHGRGVIHRDIKPANVLISAEGAVKIADFGLAKAVGGGASVALTSANLAMGTPHFMAPEAMFPDVAVDGRADLYAVGVMLHNMLTGEIPTGMFKLPSKKVGCDPRFDAIVKKAMEADREERYQTASEIRNDLDTILTTPVVHEGDEAIPVVPTNEMMRAQKLTPVPDQVVAEARKKEPPTGRPASKSAGDPPGLGRIMVIVAVLAVALIGLFAWSPWRKNSASGVPPAVRSSGDIPVAAPARPTAAGTSSLPAQSGPEARVTPPPSAGKWVDGLAAYWAGDWKDDRTFAREGSNSVRMLRDGYFMPMSPRAPPLRDAAVRVVLRRINGWNLKIRVWEPDRIGYEWQSSPSGSMETLLGVGHQGFYKKAGLTLPPDFNDRVVHTLEFRAVGSRITATLDGVATGGFDNEESKQGLCGINLPKDTIIERFDYADLRMPDASATKSAQGTGATVPASGEKWVDALAPYRAGTVKSDDSFELGPGKTVKITRDAHFQVVPAGTTPMHDQALRVTLQGVFKGTSLFLRENTDGEKSLSAQTKDELVYGAVKRGAGFYVWGRRSFPAGFHAASPHQLEMRSTGDRIVVLLDGAPLLDTTTKDTLPAGLPGIFLPAGSVIEQLDYADLGGVSGVSNAQGGPDGRSTSASLPGSTMFNGHRYQLVQVGDLSWPAAKAQAEKMGGHLATLTSAEENQMAIELAKDLLLSTNENHNAVWIGLSEKAEGDGWKWVTGEPLAFSQWLPGEPSGGRGRKVGWPLYASIWHQFSNPAIGWNSSVSSNPSGMRQSRGFLVEWDDAGVAR